MDTQTQSTPVAFSGKIPQNYDEYLGPLFFEPYAIDLAQRIKRLNSKSILEVAAGTGRLTRHLKNDLSHDTTLVATDINPAMVNFGKSHTSELNIQWMEVDAHVLPFENETFDCVVSQFGVMFYSDKVKAFKEAFRVLKKGGTFIFNCWDELKNNPLANQADIALKNFFPVDTPAFYTIPFSYFDESKIAQDVMAAGFRLPNIELVKLTGESNSAADAAKGLIEGTPTITAIQDRDAAIEPVLLEFLEQNITKLFGTKSLKINMQARVVICTK
jgi:ubiquinone/menaquinone biosynthesis C-methylase UbiE